MFSRMKGYARSPYILFNLFIFIKICIASLIVFAAISVPYILFEYSEIALILTLIEWFGRGRRKLLYFLLIDLIYTAILLTMMIYSGYFSNVPTYTALSGLKQVPSVSHSVFVLISPSYYLMLFDFVLMILYSIFKKKISYRPDWQLLNRRALAALTVIFFLVGASGLLLNRTDQILDAGRMAKKSGYLNLQLLKAFADLHHEVTEDKGADKTEIEQKKIFALKGVKPIPFADHPYFGIAKKRNLIVIQLESMQNFLIGLKVNGEEVTPNLNALSKHSFYFSNLMQQIGPGNTSDAEFLMNTSLYPDGEQPTSEVYGNKKIPSLPRLLEKNGYQTATFHVDDVTFWNRDELYPALGFDDYYDKSYFGTEDLIGLGDSDDVLYSKSLDVLKKMDKEKAPFYAHIISLTAHSPFVMPEDKQTLDLPPKFNGTLIGNYLEAQHYADAALGRFIDKLKAEGLWEDSMIVLYGDHSGVHGKLMTDKDHQLLKEMLGEPYTLMTRFPIPFMISVPGTVTDKGKTFRQTAGQIDMMPTAVNLLGIKNYNMIHFGEDLTAYKKNFLGMRYYAPAGTFFNNDIFFMPETSKYGLRIWELPSGKRVEEDYEQPGKTFENPYNRILELLRMSDDYMQHLPDRAPEKPAENE